MTLNGMMVRFDGMQSTSLLPLLPGPLWPRVVAPDWVLSMGQIELNCEKVPRKTITDTDYADDIALLANAPAPAETQLHSLERAAAGIGLPVNAHKTKYMCFNQTGNISTLNGSSLKLLDKFTYPRSSVSSNETDIALIHMALIPLGKVWIQLFSLQLWVNSRTDWILQPWWDNWSRRRKTLNSNLLNSA